jgi:hypothetical protein
MNDLRLSGPGLAVPQLRVASAIEKSSPQGRGNLSRDCHRCAEVRLTFPE